MKDHEMSDDEPVGLTRLCLAYARLMGTETSLVDFDVNLDGPDVPLVPTGRHHGADCSLN